MLVTFHGTAELSRAATYGGRARAATVVLILTAATALMVGWTNSNTPLTRAGYVRQVNSIAKKVGPVLNGLASSTSGADAAKRLLAAQVALRTTAGQLARITPPRNIKNAHTQLVKSVNELATELTPIIAKLRAGDIQALLAALSLKGIADARAAAAVIMKAGYKIQIPFLT
jgi:hypothetical protein